MKSLIGVAVALAALLASQDAFGWGAVRGPYGGAAYRGPAGGIAVRGPYGGGAYRGPAGGTSTGRPDMPTVVRIDPDIPPGQPLLGPQSA